MARGSDEILVISGEHVSGLVARPFSDGLFGKKLEEALQTLIEKHPQVIPGNQIDPESDDPPRFVLLHREMPLGGWSLDHLLVDQRAVPTLLEAKLVQNPEARREVVGQILEYAANAARVWGDGQARRKAEEFWQKKGKDIGKIIHEHLNWDNVEAFWEQVEENLEIGRIRLIIAADELRPEVERMIDYLNGEMRNARLFGLELRCYGRESDSLVLVPRIVGRAQGIRSKPDRKLWTEDLLRDAYQNLPDQRLGKVLENLLNWAKASGCLIEGKTQSPVFGLRGLMGGRIASVSPDWIYCFLDSKLYAGGTDERDRFVDDLRRLGMYEPNFNPTEVISGRNLIRRPAVLEEEELEKLKKLFSRVCVSGGIISSPAGSGL